MERFSNRESVLLGYGPQKPFMMTPKSPLRNSDIDFNDVFGGPPRRVSMQETRNSLSQTKDSFASVEDNEKAASRSSWSGLSEKPVFGEEVVSSRRYPSQDFFDDIFRGNESVSCSPRQHDISAPASRVLSPARPLPPKAEPFGSSLPAQLSLPAKLTKGKDIPVFGSSTRSQYKYKDGTANGASPYSYSYSPLSRFSSQANQGQEDSRNGVRSSYLQSPLLQELSLSSEESSNLTKSDETDNGGKSKKDSSSSEDSANGSQFHFSIYKWPSKGIPLAMPPRGGSNSRRKEILTERCSSSNGRIESKRRELPATISHDSDLASSNNNISATTESFRIECDNQLNESLANVNNQYEPEPSQIVKETILPTSDSETQRDFKSTIENAPNTASKDTREEAKPHSTAFSEKTVKETSVTPKEAQRKETKPLRSLLFNNDDKQGMEQKTGNGKRKESTTKGTEKSSSIEIGKSTEKQDGKRTVLDNVEVDKAKWPSSPARSGDLGRNGAKGRVKEFIKIFNQGAPSKPKFSIDSQSHGSRWKDKGTSKVEGEMSASSNGTNEKKHISKGNAKKTMPDAPIMPEEQHSATKSKFMSTDTSSQQKDTSESTSIPVGSKAMMVDTEESFQGNFVVKELTQDDNKLPQSVDDPDDFQNIDTKIRQWAYGKEGNIRSLLSTLQYVLWPGSGWKPAPLVDIIEGNAVKRAYQKALLCLHPDKLQQKGAASHQKYIAEKVFDILQDAWTHFSSLDSL